MAIWQIVAYLAGAFFTAGLAVIPQNICLAIWFFVASVVLGLVAIYIHHHVHKRYQKIIKQLTEYVQQETRLTHYTPKTEKGFDDLKVQYTDWHNAVYSWLNTVSPADATRFTAPRDRISLKYDGFGGHEYQTIRNSLMSRLENLRELLGEYLTRHN